MLRFKYKAKDLQGKIVAGVVEGPDDKSAAKLLRGKKLVVISLNPVRQTPLDIFKKFSERITSGDIVNFTRQLATMINAGLPITDGLLILRNQSKGKFQDIVANILSDVEEGRPLSTALAVYPNIFNKTYIALIKSGEVGGVLDEVLARLADTLEKQEEFRGKVKGAMIYPIIIVLAMIGVAFVMLVFVLPKLTTLYTQFDAKLPLTTQFIIFLSGFMSKFWPFILIGIVLLAYGFKLYRGTKSGKKMIDSLILKIPLIGDLQRQVVLADLTRTISLMVGSGVSILESINIASEAVGNTVISEDLADIGKQIEKGFPVSFAFAKHSDTFPQILSQMISVGEETGKMDEVLSKVSHVFETESDTKLKAITAAVEPAILIVLGLGVAFLVISIIMPIYNLTTQL
jgi:type IV pilus assembly protein PilC